MTRVSKDPEGIMWSHLLKLVVVDAHEGDLGAAALVELVAAGLTAKALEQQLSAEVAEGQREKGLPHLKVKDKQHPSGLWLRLQCCQSRSSDLLTKLCVVSGTFSNTSTCNSSKVSQEMSVSQPIGFFSLEQQVRRSGDTRPPLLIKNNSKQTYLEAMTLS